MSNMSFPLSFPFFSAKDPLTQQLHLALQGKTNEAFALNNELTARFPDDHRVAFNRGWFLLSQGKLKEGFDCLNRGRFENVFGSPPLRTPAPLWRGEDLTGKTVMLRGEGGLGDQIINIRFAKQLAERGAKVVVSADGGLLPVFQRIEGVSAAVLAGHESAVFHHYWIPAMSAPGLLHDTYASLDAAPYLTADLQAVAKWATILKGSAPIKVGVRWTGNPRFEHEQFRKVPKQALWAALSGLPRIQFYSLELESDPELPAWITPLGSLLNTWEDTLGAISQLDLVISSCTSVAHASAAMGTPTAVLVPVLPYYIWSSPGEYSPWYESVRLFRQQQFGDWSEPLERVSEMLAKMRPD